MTKTLIYGKPGNRYDTVEEGASIKKGGIIIMIFIKIEEWRSLPNIPPELLYGDLEETNES